MTNRNDKGQFLPGNPGGTGNPFSKTVNRLRSAFLKCVSEEDIKGIAEVIIEKAKGGDLAAIKILFERTFGRVEVVEPEQEFQKPADYDEIKRKFEILVERRIQERLAAQKKK